MAGFNDFLFPIVLLCLAVLAAILIHRYMQHSQATEHPQEAPQPPEPCHALFDTPLFGCIETDLDGVVLSVNQAECGLRGRGAGEITGKYVWDLELDPVKDRELFQKISQGPEEPTLRRHTYIRHDRAVTVDSHPIRLRNSSGHITGFLFVSVDVTAAQAAGEEAERTNQELKAIFDAFPDSFLRLDTEGRVLDYKPASAAESALPPGKYVGGKIQDLLPGEAGRRVLQALGEAARSNATAPVEFSLPSGEGEKHFEIRLSPIHWKEVMALVRNVSAKKQAEERIRAYTMELQEKNEELADALITAREATNIKRRFVANLSHEIRTPINGAAGMSELLLGTELTAEQREYAEAIGRSVGDLLKVVDGVLDLSRIESGKLKVQHTPFDVRRIVKETIDAHTLEAGFKALALKCDIETEVPRIAEGDPERLRQVLDNLLDNAIKFTERGQVSVRVAQSYSNGSITLRFAVEDTGIGIEPAQAQRLFESFTQGDPSSTKRHRGLGLGLAISKQLVEMMGGEIAVDSAPGRGTTFSFTVVLGRHESQGFAGVASAAELKKLRVLVAEHDAAERSRICGLLAFWECQYTEVDRGGDVARNLRSFALGGGAFDVALVATDLPDEDALTVARAVKADSVTRDVVLIALLPASMRSDGQALRAIGYASCVQKPAQAADLHDTIVEEIRSIRVQPVEPRARHSRPHSVSVSRPADGPRSGSVLLAEDDPVNQKIVLRLLEKMGLEADAVFDGQRAFEAATGKKYDLVLMDLQMPKMDGLEATAAIRFKEGSSCHTPILALTANAMPGDRERCLAAGMDDYLSKPVSLEILRNAISQWLVRQG